MKKILQTIKKYKTFVISTHVNPDPDALCSELAMAAYLHSIGKKAYVINEKTVPDRFSFFPGSSKIKEYSPESKLKFDAVIVLDCGDLSRIGKVEGLIEKNHRVINIDHHVTNDSFGDVNYVNPKASSTAEILYEMLKMGRCKFTKNIALCLYAGIMTDTGSFRFANTTPKTHKIVSELVKFKFSTYGIYRKIYENIPLSDLKEFTQVISRFDTLYDGKVLCVELKKNVLEKFSDYFDLRDTIFKFLRSTRGAEAFVIFTEVSSKLTRINLRSTGKVNVAKLANQFSGGGHKNASGCQFESDLKHTRKVFLTAMRRAL